VSRYSELLGVKVKPETKSSINELTEKLETAGKISYKGDVFDFLLQQADLRNLEEEMSYGAQLKELQQHTERINQIFVGLAKQNDVNVQYIQQEHEKQRGRLQEALELQTEKNRTLEEALTQEADNNSKLTDELMVNQKKLNEYSERVDEQKKMILSQQSELDNKNEEIKSLHHLKEQNNELRSTLQDADKANEGLVQKTEGLEALIEQNKERHQKDIEQKEFEHQKALFSKEKELQDKHNEELEKIRVSREEITEKLQDKYSQELEKARLLREEISQKYQEKLEALQEKYNALFEEHQKNETALKSQMKESDEE
jgi:hypothetical protein